MLFYGCVQQPAMVSVGKRFCQRLRVTSYRVVSQSGCVERIQAAVYPSLLRLTRRPDGQETSLWPSSSTRSCSGSDLMLLRWLFVKMLVLWVWMQSLFGPCWCKRSQIKWMFEQQERERKQIVRGLSLPSGVGRCIQGFICCYFCF